MLSLLITDLYWCDKQSYLHCKHCNPNKIKCESETLAWKLSINYILNKLQTIFNDVNLGMSGIVAVFWLFVVKISK